MNNPTDSNLNRLRKRKKTPFLMSDSDISDMKYRLLSCVDIVLSGLASNVPDDDDDDDNNNNNNAYDDDAYDDDDTNTNNNDNNACKIPFFLL